VNPQNDRKILQALILWPLDIDRETILGLLVHILCERQGLNKANGFSDFPNIRCNNRWCEQVLRADVSVLSRLLDSRKLVIEQSSMIEPRGVSVWDSQVIACSGDYILFSLEAGIGCFDDRGWAAIDESTEKLG